MVDLTDKELSSDAWVLHPRYILPMVKLHEQVFIVVNHNFDVTAETLDEVVPFDDLLLQFRDLALEVDIFLD